jgi:phenylacetate-CoA ligase
VQKIKGESAARALDELSQCQWKSRDELLFEQWQMLRRTVTKAIQEVPYYRETYSRVGWDSSNKNFVYEDFLNLPIVEKEDVRDRLAEFLNPNYQGRITQGSTSGSTGKSLKLFYSGEHESYSEAARWRSKAWWEITPGSPQVTIWGRPFTSDRDRLVQKAKSYLMNTLLFSGFDLQEKSLSRIWKKILTFKPSIIYGYPSAIYILAMYLQENSIDADRLAIKVIITPGELITTQQRELIEKVFRCKTANEYGCSETGGFVYECPQGSWHISSELTFVEFLDEQGNPVTSGQTGEIVLTHLRNDYMPLIRYRVGDLGAPLSEMCSCGRGLPLMEVSVAKESDVFRLANGRTYSSKIFDYINIAVSKTYPSSVLQFRVIQKSLDIFEVEIVNGQDKSGRGEELFEQLMRQQLGRDIEINMRRVPEITRESSGKLRYFIPDFNGIH